MTKFTFWYETDNKDSIDPDVSLSFAMDEGSGITMDALARMFYRFAQALSYPESLINKYILETYNED